MVNSMLYVFYHNKKKKKKQSDHDTPLTISLPQLKPSMAPHGLKDNV